VIKLLKNETGQLLVDLENVAIDSNEDLPVKEPWQLIVMAVRDPQGEAIKLLSYELLIRFRHHEGHTALA
jgi:hypothetical protein